MVKKYSFNSKAEALRIMGLLESSGLRYDVLSFACKDIDKYVLKLDVPVRNELQVHEIYSLASKKK